MSDLSQADTHERTPAADCAMTYVNVRGEPVARRCYCCGSRVFLHRRRKPFACKTCGYKMPRVLS